MAAALFHRRLAIVGIVFHSDESALLFWKFSSSCAQAQKAWHRGRQVIRWATGFLPRQSHHPSSRWMVLLIIKRVPVLKLHFQAHNTL